jgi:hypothetical protein
MPVVVVLSDDAIRPGRRTAAPHGVGVLPGSDTRANRRVDSRTGVTHDRGQCCDPASDSPRCRRCKRPWPPSDVGEPTVGLYLHGAHLVSSRRIRRFMPTTGVPAPQEPHKTDDRRHPGRDHRRPHQHSSQPHAPLNSDDPLLRMPKPGQLVHAHRDAHDRLGETRLGETRYTGSNAGEGLFDQPSVPRSGDRGVDRLVKVSRGSCRATARAMHRLTSVVAPWEGVSCSAQSSIPLRFSYASDRGR